MTNHLSYPELVEVALLPDEQPDAVLHLASCTECDRLLSEIRAELQSEQQAHTDSVEGKHPTFWKRQAIGVMREITRRKRRSTLANGSLAAVATLVIALGGFWVGRSTAPQSPSYDIGPAIATQTTSGQPAPLASQQLLTVPTEELSVDPWDTEQVNEYQAVVDWESWVEEDEKEHGTI